MTNASHVDARILGVLDSLAATTKRKEKTAILEQSMSDEDFMTFVVSTLNPNINFYITKIPYIERAVPHPDVRNIMDAIRILTNSLAGRDVSGNLAKSLVAGVCASLSPEGQTLVERFLKRDLRCGVSVKTLNAAAGVELIYVPGYMRCSGYSEKTLSKLKFPVYTQDKMDGLFLNLKVQDGYVSALSRSGKTLTHILPDIDLDLIDGYDPLEAVYHGEALALDENGQLMDRETGNGYLNSDDVDPSRVQLVLWDAVPIEAFLDGESAAVYKDRLEQTRLFVEKINHPQIKLIDTVVSNTAEDVCNHFRDARLLGGEGIVIKAPKGVWKDGTSKDVIKVKVVFECDLEIVKVREGEGRLAGMAGSIECKTVEGLLIVGVGTGYSDAQRVDFWKAKEFLEGKICKVKGNGVTVTETDKEGNPVLYSMFLPRFVETRADKIEADTLARVQEQEESFTDMLRLID